MIGTLFLYLQMFVDGILKLPKLICFWTKDFYLYIKNKGWRRFKGWGMHLFIGRFGAGKTSTMVSRAYALCCKYKELSIVTNLELKCFPLYTKILPLHSVDDILKAPEACLVLIDEIGTIFNSRDFTNKDSLPKVLFQYLCQCRHRRLMIYGTVQRWNFLDKQLRDITDTVFSSRMVFAHPFSRLAIVFRYDAKEYDDAYNNPMLSINPLGGYLYVQTDKLRKLYDTEALVSNMLRKRSSDFLSDEEILASRGEQPKSYESPTFKGNRNKKKKRHLL